MTNEANDTLLNSNVFPWPKDEFQRWGMALARNYDLERKGVAGTEKPEDSSVQRIASNLIDTSNGSCH